MNLGMFRSLGEFFREHLGRALHGQRLQASAEIECYLVNLLSDYAHAPLDDEPLALRYGEARTAPPQERAQKLRQVGDQSLYTAGFFADSLERQLVDVNYYVTLGASAYRQLGHRGQRPLGDVFVELGERFDRYVEVLAEVAAATLHRDGDVVRLYERWLRTGSPTCERQLVARGVRLSRRASS